MLSDEIVELPYTSTYMEPISNSLKVNTSLLDLTIVCYQLEIIEPLQAGLQADKYAAIIMMLQSLWCCFLLFPTKHCLKHPITIPLLFQTWLWSPASLHLIALSPYSTLLYLLFMALYLYLMRNIYKLQFFKDYCIRFVLADFSEGCQNHGSETQTFWLQTSVFASKHRRLQLLNIRTAKKSLPWPTGHFYP